MVFLGKSKTGENVRNGGQCRVHEHRAVRALGFNRQGRTEIALKMIIRAHCLRQPGWGAWRV